MRMGRMELDKWKRRVPYIHSAKDIVYKGEYLALVTVAVVRA
jgi:hypothetical protein